jgi:hypothetical protein
MKAKMSKFSFILYEITAAQAAIKLIIFNPIKRVFLSTLIDLLVQVNRGKKKVL